jgi:hypothetical protein
MQGTSLVLENEQDSLTPVEQRRRPTRRTGRHRLAISAGRHRHARRIAPVTAGVLTVVVGIAVALVGQSVRPTQDGPELDTALTEARESAVSATVVAPPPAPLPTPPMPTVAATSPSSEPASTPSAALTSTTSRRFSPAPSSSKAAPPKDPKTRGGMPSGGAVQFRGDFDTGNSSQWELETAKNYSLTVRDGGPGHPTAGRFEVRDGDTPVDSGERSEAKLPDQFDVSEGDERWYSFSMMFDKSFPVPADGWCDPMQWHPANSDHSAAEGSPPLNLQCGNNGDDKLYLQVGDRELLPIGMLDRGVWHRYLLHVKFSRNAGEAFEEVHRDGQLVLPRTSPKSANMNAPKLYLKVGMYRKQTNNGPMVVWHDDMAVYTSAPKLSGQ